MPTNKPWFWKKKRPNWQTNYEYYQWTKERIKYRSKLNQENRKRGDYGNWDWKDLSHMDNNPKNFSKKNLRKQPAAVNRRAWAAKANRKKKSDSLYV